MQQPNLSSTADGQIIQFQGWLTDTDRQTLTLTAHDVANMDPADLLAVGVEVASFLASKADRLSVSPAK